MTCFNCKKEKDIHPTNDCEEFKPQPINDRQKVIDEIISYICNTHYNEEDFIEFLKNLRNG